MKLTIPDTAQWAAAIEGLRHEHDLNLLLDLRKTVCSVFYYHRKHLNTDDKQGK